VHATRLEEKKRERDGLSVGSHLSQSGAPLSLLAGPRRACVCCLSAARVGRPRGGAARVGRREETREQISNLLSTPPRSPWPTRALLLRAVSGRAPAAAMPVRVPFSDHHRPAAAARAPPTADRRRQPSPLSRWRRRTALDAPVPRLTGQLAAARCLWVDACASLTLSLLPPPPTTTCAAALPFLLTARCSPRRPFCS